MPKAKKRAAAPSATISLRQACLRIGISVPTAAKISDFPRIFWMGQRRYVMRRQLDRWLAARGG